ncbi:MAG: HprK-related kinase A [Burkholderiaceae bacterium]|nr:HprK-related kinase A [Burkholderiaceae bacterium]
MRVAELGPRELTERLRGEGVALDFGAAPGFAAAFAAVYPRFELASPSGFFDVTVRLRRAGGLRRFLRPQVELVADGRTMFAPFPADTHLPLLEWAMNFLFAERLGFHLLLHAGVVERDGQAVILPAMPGSGKSTLTAALAARGFRLLSDEFGVVRFADGMLLPLLRPVALKNESIDVIARFAPQAAIGPRFPKTRKGTVAHMAPDARAVENCHVAARPALIVFPRYDPKVGCVVEPEKRSHAFNRLSINSFNYEMLGPASFDAVTRLIGGCRV